eukprot:11125-Heterococcus_DN1.PRE.2
MLANLYSTTGSLQANRNTHGVTIMLLSGSSVQRHRASCAALCSLSAVVSSCLRYDILNGDHS